jgi:hypothetical protein
MLSVSRNVGVKFNMVNCRRKLGEVLHELARYSVFTGKKRGITGSWYTCCDIENIFFCNISTGWKECGHSEIKSFGDGSAFLLKNSHKKCSGIKTQDIKVTSNKQMLPLYSKIRNRLHSAMGKPQKSVSFVPDYTSAGCSTIICRIAASSNNTVRLQKIKYGGSNE